MDSSFTVLYIIRDDSRSGAWLKAIVSLPSLGENPMAASYIGFHSNKLILLPWLDLIFIECKL